MKNVVTLLVAVVLLALSFAGWSQTTVSANNGWNMFGNTSSTSLVVSPTLFPASSVQTVWKWDTASANWQFFTPQLIDGGQAYATSKGYGFLTTINAGDGFWVNAKTSFSFQLPAGAISTTTVKSSLNVGWNLVAIGDNKTPQQFNSLISTSANTIPTDALITLWTWDNPSSLWYLYAPALDLNGTLANYIAGKGYLDFGTKTLDSTTGFWVNSLIKGDNALHYTDKVYALWTAAYPYAVTKTGVMMVVNKTQYPGIFSFTNCWLADKPLADGKVLANCQDNITPPFVRHIFYIDPTKDEIYDYADAVPTDVVWHSSTPYDPLKPNWGPKTRVSDGWYFTTNPGGRVLYFQADTTGIVTVVKDGTSDLDEILRLLMSYNN